MRVEEYIINQSAGSLYWKGMDGKYLGCNKNFYELCRLKSACEIVGKTDRELFLHILGEEDFKQLIDLDKILEADRKVIADGETIVCEETGINEKGEIAIYLSKKAPLLDERGYIIGIIGTSIDITKEKQAEVLKTEFIQNMQHDIRTPSAGLWGVLDFLSRTETDSMKKEALDMALNASKRLLDLCNDVVEFSEVGKNTRLIREEPVDIRDIATKVVELNLPAAFTKDLIIHFKVDSIVPPCIMSDEFRLSRILVNLLGNAIKFTDKGEVFLNISTKLEQGERYALLKIEIKDTGIGIAADKIEHIYKKFTRAVASNTNKFSGTGLGLYVVKTFIDELDGDIELESRENKGTAVKLIIPFKVRWADMGKSGKQIDEHFTSPFHEHAAKRA